MAKHSHNSPEAIAERNRPQIIKFHHSGMQIKMYYDAPGEYYDLHGNPLPVAIAKSAGYDVDKDARLAQLQRELKKSRADLEARYRAEEDKLLTDLNKTADNIYVRQMSPGKYGIFVIGTDIKLTPHALSREEAELMFEQMKIKAGDGSALGDELI